MSIELSPLNKNYRPEDMVIFDPKLGKFLVDIDSDCSCFSTKNSVKKTWKAFQEAIKPVPLRIEGVDIQTKYPLFPLTVQLYESIRKKREENDEQLHRITRESSYPKKSVDTLSTSFHSTPPKKIPHPIQTKEGSFTHELCSPSPLRDLGIPAFKSTPSFGSPDLSRSSTSQQLGYADSPKQRGYVNRETDRVETLWLELLGASLANPIERSKREESPSLTSMNPTDWQMRNSLAEFMGAPMVAPPKIIPSPIHPHHIPIKPFDAGEHHSFSTSSEVPIQIPNTIREESVHHPT